MQHSIRMTPVQIRRSRHDPVTVALHWVTAALVAALWTIGQTVDFFPNGPLRIDYRSIHILLGAILAELSPLLFHLVEINDGRPVVAPNASRENR